MVAPDTQPVAHHLRIEAVQAVLMQGVQAELRQCGQPFSAASINSMLS